MTKLIWGADRSYEVGVDKGVLYPQSGPGVAWNGLTQVKEAPSDSDSVTTYVDGYPFRNGRTSEGFAGTIEAVTYPDEFEPYDGYSEIASAQNRIEFGFSYRVMIDSGPDYKIHLVYNVLSHPSANNWSSLTDKSDINTFSWDFSSRPNQIPGSVATSHLIIDSTIAYASVLSDLEDLLYGTDITDPSLPSPADVIAIFEANSILQIIDNGDGTWTAISQDAYPDIITMTDSTTFEIDWLSAVFIDTDSYTLTSL